MRSAHDRPNLVLINCDDLGYGDLGCVEQPATLTTYDPSHPYICAEYDLPEAG